MTRLKERIAALARPEENKCPLIADLIAPGDLVVLVVPNVLNLAVYGWGRDAAYLRSYAGKLAAKLKRKGKAE